MTMPNFFFYDYLEVGYHKINYTMFSHMLLWSTGAICTHFTILFMCGKIVAVYFGFPNF